MQKQQVKNISDLFTPALTKLFKTDMDRALRSMDFNKVVDVLTDYKIAHFNDSIDFLEALEPILNQWKKKGMGSEVIAVTTSCSRCIACEIGRKVTVYEFEYRHSKAPAPMNRVHYTQDFGILMDIRNNILFEIRVCNAFLDKEEMNELT